MCIEVVESCLIISRELVCPPSVLLEDFEAGCSENIATCKDCSLLECDAV